MDSTLKELCIQLYDIGALKFGEYKMKSGASSPVYFDLRIMISYPKIMRSLSELLWELAQSHGVSCDVICGVPYTALPLASIIAVNNNLPMLIRRKEPKDYGTKKLIEGVFNKADVCLIIEDVVTTGSSILETVEDLKNDGLAVKETVIVLDREQGGADNLIKHGITMRALLTLSQVLKYLNLAGKVDDKLVEKIQAYIKQNQLDTRGNTKLYDKPRVAMSLESRAQLAPCQVATRLLQLMADKKSNLCVAVDVTKSKTLLELTAAVGPHAAMVKTHSDFVLDWSAETASQLRALAKQHNFLIMEDRKFADIGHTVGLQYSLVMSWADLVTVHGLSGDGLLVAVEEEVAKQSEPRGVFIVAQLSCKDNLITPSYTKSVIQQAAAHPQLVAGLVCQSVDVVMTPGLLQLTPGVSQSQASDSLGQQYNSPHTVVCEQGADLAVVGRAIVTATDPSAAAEQYKTLLWDAYLERIKHQNYT